MNSLQTAEHRVEPTAAGRFAVVTPTGETLAVMFSEAAAITAAAALDSEPVRSVNAQGRWQEKAA